MKKGSIVSLLLVVTMIFVGCTSEELKLYSAFEKTQDITSMESKTDINFTLDIENVPDEDQQMVQQMISALNDFKLSTYQKTVVNKEKTISKAEAEMGVNVGGMQMDMNVWVDVDMSEKQPKMVEVIKMPQILMAPLAQNGITKEYIVYDIGKMMTESDEQIDFSKLMDFSKDMQSNFKDAAREYFANFDPGFKVITPKGRKVIDGESLNIYEIKLDDTKFKNLMRYTVNDFLEKDEVIDFAKAYMKVVSDMVNMNVHEEDMSIEEMNEELEDLKENLPEFKEEFNEFMDKLDKVNVLGDQGITIEYGVNKDGYITHEEGMIDLRIDVADMDHTFNDGDLSEHLLDGKAPIVKLGINFKTNIYNINQPMEVKMPETNPENAIYFEDLMEYAASQVTPDLDIDVSEMDIVVNDDVIETQSAYMNEEGTVMVPLRDIAEALGYEVTWNNQLRSIMLDQDISLKIGDDDYTYMKGGTIELEDAPELVKGTTYVPLNFFEEITKGNYVYVDGFQIIIWNESIIQ